MELLMKVVRMKIPNNKSLSKLFGSREGMLLTSSSQGLRSLRKIYIATTKIDAPKIFG